MKKVFLGLAMLMFTAITFAQSATQEPPIVGNDRDAHGCIGSAGYTYSELKKECIRVFEQKILLVSKDGTQQTALIFNQNKSKVEAFVPGNGSVILKRVGKKGKSWKNDGYTVTKTKKGYSLKKSKEVIFSSK